MHKVTIVTGPLRSGTSCVTGLLELCGFDLGKNVRILRNPTPMNPRGHFEPDLLFTVNERLLFESGEEQNGIFTPPATADLMALAADRERYFRLFINKFDGELCKDPLLCLTLAAWRLYWPELQRAIFCLRHPLAVALSMRDRYGLSLMAGMTIWERYTLSFLEGSSGMAAFIFDFDQFCREPLPKFGDLLQWLGCPMAAADLRNIMNDFFLPRYAAWDFNQTVWDEAPAPVKNLYDMLTRATGDLANAADVLGCRRENEGTLNG